MQRLGILGGTFDPIHHGHLAAAQEAHYQLELDQVWFVPAGAPPHKPGRPISPVADRLRMVELAIEGDPRFALSRIDVGRPGPSYTADTLHLLREMLGEEVRLFFVEGADSLAEMLAWHQPERIVALAELAVVARPGVEIDLAELEAALPGLREALYRVDMPLLEISSSDIRRRVRSGRPISYLVPAAVEAYIHDAGLYR